MAKEKSILLLCLVILWVLPLTPILQTEASFETIIDVSKYPGATQTEQIQAALNDVPPSGAIVVVPEGIWQVANLTGVSNVIFTGKKGTILQLIAQTPIITFNSNYNFIVQNFTINGAGILGGTAIRVIGNSYNFTIRNNFFQDVNTTAVNIELPEVGQEISDFTVTNNTFTNCQDATIRIFGIVGRRDIRRFQITQNRIMEAFDNGKIAVAFAKDGLIANNQVLNTEHGIATRSVSSITIENNVIRNVTNRGIYLGTNPGDPGSDNVTIRGNTISQSGIGLSKWYGSQTYKNILVYGNTIYNSTLADIQADFSATFINNTITSRAKLEILDPSTKFIGTKDITGQPILPADINNDFITDILDIAIVAKAYGSTEQSPGWNAVADVIKDGIIDIDDISFVAINYGQTA
jgi:hypothetical protein